MKFIGYTQPLNPQPHSTIDTIDQLSELLSYHFIEGSAKEVSVHNEEMFLELVANLSKIGTQQDLGGNGAMIAHSAYLAGAQILLGTPLDLLNFEDLFNKNISIAHGLTDQLDIHVVFNFFEDKEWGGVRTKRSNRFYVNFDKKVFGDMDNFHLKNIEFLPDIYVIGGLQLINGPHALEKVSNITSHLSQITNKTKIHFEMASFTNQTIMNTIFSDIIKKCDSLGFNEQEMGQLLALSNGITNTTSLGFDSKMEVNEALELLTDLIGNYTQFNVSRFHLHSLNAQMICHNNLWELPEIALMKSILISLQTAYTLQNKEINLQLYDFDLVDLEINFPQHLILPVLNSEPIHRIFDPDNPISCWNTSSQYHCCVGPNLITSKALRYRALGDHISGMALAFHKIR